MPAASILSLSAFFDDLACLMASFVFVFLFGFLVDLKT